MPGFFDDYQDDIAEGLRLREQSPPVRQSLFAPYADDVEAGISLREQDSQATPEQQPEPAKPSWMEWLSPPTQPAAPAYVPLGEGGSQGNVAAQQAMDAEASATQQVELQARMNAAREKIRSMPAEASALQGFMDTARHVPGVKGSLDAVMNVLASKAAERVNNGEGTDEDFTTLAEVERLAQVNSERTGFWQGVYDIALGSAPFMTGMGLSSGIRNAAGQAVKAGTGSKLASAAASVAAGTVNPAMVPLIGREAADYAAPEITEDGQVIQGDDAGTAIAKGVASTALEVGSEGIGGAISPALAKLTPAWAKQIAAKVRGPKGSLREAIAETLQAAGIQNAPVELIEERVVDITKGGTGLADDYGMFSRDLEGATQQALQEIVFFGALQAPSAVMAASDSIQKRRKGESDVLRGGGGSDGGTPAVEAGPERLPEAALDEGAGWVEPDSVLPPAVGEGASEVGRGVEEQSPGVATSPIAETHITEDMKPAIGQPKESLDWEALTAQAIGSIRQKFPGLNVQDAEDLAQETMLRVSQSYDPSKGTPQALVNTILGRLAIDAHRKGVRTGETVGVPEGAEPVYQAVPPEIGIEQLETLSDADLRKYVRDNHPGVSTSKGRKTILGQLSDILSQNTEQSDVAAPESGALGGGINAGNEGDESLPTRSTLGGADVVPTAAGGGIDAVNAGERSLPSMGAGEGNVNADVGQQDISATIPAGGQPTPSVGDGRGGSVDPNATISGGLPTELLPSDPMEGQTATAVSGDQPTARQPQPGDTQLEEIGSLRMKSAAYVEMAWRKEAGGRAIPPSKSEMLEEIRNVRATKTPIASVPGEQATIPPAEKPAYEFSSTQINLPEPIAKASLAASRKIADEDLTDKGRETEPHVTVKYGLHTDNADEVREILADEPPIRVKLGKSSFFPASESGTADVVKVDVESEDLRRLNTKISEALETTDTHPTYQPHVTLGYVKPGMGEKYSGMEDLAGQETVVSSIKFAGKDGTSVEIPLLGTRAAKPEVSGQNPATNPDILSGKSKDSPEIRTYPDKPASLPEHFASQLFHGRTYTSITQARQEAAEFLGTPVEPGTPLAKQVDEAVEQGLVREAERIAAKSDDDDVTFDRLLDLYQRQPTLGTRTSTQLIDQAFSTPAPLAWVASVMADVKKTDVVYDSSAGNGMLLIGASNAIANEINKERVQALRDNQAGEVTQNDATSYRPSKPVDKVIINPPFGVVEENGREKTWDIDGFKTNQVDHAIVMNTLPAMKDDGRAVVIIGAKGFEKGEPKDDLRRASAYRNRAPFYHKLYDEYNVVDHFTVSGDMYAKQGAKFPVDVLVIDGKGASSRPKPFNFKAGGLPQVVNSWEQLKDEKLNRRSVVDTGAGSAVSPSVEGRDVKPVGVEGTATPADRRSGEGVTSEPGGRVERSNGPVSVDEQSRTDSGDARVPGDDGTPSSKPGSVPDDGGGDATGKRGSTGSSDVVERDSDTAEGLSDEEIMAAALEAEFGENDPVSETGKLPVSGKSTAKSPRKKKAEARRDRTKKALDDVLSEFKDVFGTTFDSGLDPKKVAVTVKLTRAAIDHGVSVFADYVAFVADNVGASNAGKIGEYLELSWRVLGKRPEFSHLDAASSVKDILEPAKSGAKPVMSDKETEFQVKYTPGSKGNSLGTLVPKTHAQAVQRSLENIREEHGDLDEFVRKELGPRVNMDELAAEQVDAIAMAIFKHRQGKAFINGDQTGVGKGRVAAAMMEYAKNQGLVPIFITQDSSLFADMIRDLTDIGINTETQPFEMLATNALTSSGDTDSTLHLPDGRIIKQTAGTAKANLSGAVENYIKNGELSTKKRGKFKKYDAIFTTYSQLAPYQQKWLDRHENLKLIAPHAFFIFDESHNAGGSKLLENDEMETDEQSLSGAMFARDLLDKSEGAMFLSATFAKRPEVMPLYAKTGMTDAVKKVEDLPGAIAKGGVPLQQILSEMLVEGGGYLRRERSYDGVAFDPKVVDVGLEKAEDLSAVFRQIDLFDRAKADAMSDMEDNIVSGGGDIRDDNATGDRGVTSVSFSSLLWNLSDQMLLGLKADAAAQEAIDSWKRGETPVVALDNTMEAALDHYLEENPAGVGDEIDFTFKSLLEKYLERSRRVTVKSDTPMAEYEFGGSTLIKHEVLRYKKGPNRGQEYNRYYLRLTDKQLGEDAMELYREAQKMISEFSADIPASPIDRIRMRMEQAGMRIAEVTGRESMIKYTPDGKMYLAERPASEAGKSGKRRTIDGLNNGTLDGIIINRSGATGLSIHASEKFKNQRKRHMIIAQAAKNIDEFMQVLGRIHRTGQVVLPKFTLLMSNAPAETRPASVLVKKLSSLNANVTASAAGSVSFDAPDILNSVGDRIVAEYMAENLEINEALNSPVKINRNGTPTEVSGAAKKVSGRVVLLPIAEQERFWEDVVKAFNDEIAELNRMHKNPLQASSVPLAAKTLESFEIFEGDRDSDSPFLQPANLETVKAKKLGEPMKPEEVKEKVAAFYGGDSSGPKIRNWIAKQVNDIEAAADSEYQRRQEKIVNDEARVRLRDSIDTNVETIRKAIREMPPGAVVLVGNEGTGGVITSIKPKSDKHLVTPSGWIAEIALASPDRIARVPLSRIEKLEVIGGEELPDDGLVRISPAGRIANQNDYDSFTDPGEAFEERHIATGNILAAFSELQEEKGSVVFFSDSEGNDRRGVLLPRSFDPKKWAEKRPVVFEHSDHVLSFLEQGGALQSPDFAIQLTMNENGELELRSPLSRHKSGKYTTSREILAAAGRDFVSRGKIMMMTVAKNRATRVIDAVLEIGSLQTGLQKELARQITDKVSETPSKPRSPGKGSGQSESGDRASGSKDDHAGAAPAPGSAERTGVKPGKPTTEGGVSLVEKLKRDIDKGTKKVGMPSINRFLAEAFGGELFVTNRNTTRRRPALFRRGTAAILSRASSTTLNVHEAGHAMSSWIRDEAPKWMEEHEMLLQSFGERQTQVGNASAPTAEEGIAEFVRLYVTKPSDLPANVNEAMTNLLKLSSPFALDTLNDARAAYDLHAGRDLIEQQIADSQDVEKSTDVTRTAAFYWGTLHNLIGKSPLLHRYKSRIWNEVSGTNAMLQVDKSGTLAIAAEVANKAYQRSSREARQVMKKMHDTPMDADRAYANLVRSPMATMQAMSDMKDGHGGVRVYVRGGVSRKGEVVQEVISKKGWETLRETFPALQENVPLDGEEVMLFPRTYDSIKQDVGEDRWLEFVQHVRNRASVERFREAGHRYPGIERHSPSTLEKAYKQAFLDNPEWNDSYDDLRGFMDSLLVIEVLGGRRTVSEAVTMATKWEHYAPLQRQVENQTGGTRSKMDIDPDFGSYGARGSDKEFRDLDANVHQRVTNAMDAYYENEFIGAVDDNLAAISANKEIDYETRTALARIMIPMSKDIKLVANLSDNEQREVLADGINRTVLAELNVDAEGMSAKEVADMLETAGAEPISADDINFMMPGKPIFRAKKPKGQIATRWMNGKPHYRWITDPVMFTMFSSVEKPHKNVRLLERLFKGLQDPWKRNITQTLGFTIRNLPRDATTALLLNEGNVVPGAYAAIALMERTVGSDLSKEARAPAELLSKALDVTTTSAHRSKVDTFLAVLGEGVVVPGFWGLSSIEKAAVIPGMGMSTALKPWDMFNYITGQRYASELTESLTREGAYIAERKSGSTPAKARQKYDMASGFFAQRQGSPTLKAVFRVAGFLNPAIQISYQMYESFSHPDPKVRAKQALVKAPWVAGIGAMLAAGSMALLRAIHDDDDDFQAAIDAIMDTPEPERLGHAHIGGVFRMPFDHGAGGALMSMGYNTTLDYLANAPDDAERQKRIARLLSRGLQLPISGGVNLADASEDARELTEVMFLPTPPAAKTVGELLWNHSLYWNEDIVPRYMIDNEHMEPWERDYWTTPDLYRELGKETNTSPLKWQYATRNLLTSAVDDTIKLIDKMKKGNADWKDIPTFRSLIVQESTGRRSRGVQTIEDADKDYKAAMRTIELNLDNMDSEEYVEAMDAVLSLHTAHEAAREVNRLQRQINTERKMGDPDYAEIEKLEKQMTTVARQAASGEYSNTTPLDALPDELRAAVTEYYTEFMGRREQRQGGGLKGQPVKPRESEYKGRKKAFQDAMFRYEERQREWKAQKAVDLELFRARKESREKSQE